MKITRTQLKQLIKEAIGDTTFDDLKRNINKYAKVDIDEPTEIDDKGHRRWRNKKGQLHRDGDKPAVILANGTQYWFRNGEIHRDNDLPAVIRASGTKEWYQHGELHRDNGKPAIVYGDGTKEWYKNGEFIKSTEFPHGEPKVGTDMIKLPRNWPGRGRP
jgi:antitoxin component YwqK of YwqJK toxin-antitoxin module